MGWHPSHRCSNDACLPWTEVGCWPAGRDGIAATGQTSSMADAAIPVNRDRDATGRARNARPRDALGRPLPYGSADVPRQPEGQRRTPDETIVEAQRLLDAGLPFHAHEVFEDAWKASAGPDRALWKGLAQLAVGLTHVGRGNLRGARTLLHRGAGAIAPYRDDPPYDLDIASLCRWVDDAVADLDGPDPVAVLGLPQLRTVR